VVDAVNRDQQQSPNLRTHHHHIVQMKWKYQHVLKINNIK
jgi:hypothetical protein